MICYRQPASFAGVAEGEGRRPNIGLAALYLSHGASMPKTLIRLVYRSKSLMTPDDTTTVKAIFETSRRNNKRDRITAA